MIQTPTQSGIMRAGAGTRIGSNSEGVWISNPNTGMSFNHPFRPVLVGATDAAGLRFSKGVVDGFEPVIDDVPISGGPGKLPPILKLTGEITAKTKESWAILTVRPNDKGSLDKDSQIKIMHSLTPVGMTGGTVGRLPVAMITWSKGKPVMVWPLVFFNLSYVQRKASSTEPARHFFL